MRTTSLSSGGHRVGRRGLWAAVTFVGLVLVVVDSAPATFDFGSWNGVGAGTYLNGDTVTVNLGPNTGFFGNTFSSNAVGALFDQPGASQYSHVANTVPQPSWKVTVDLGNYHVSMQTVFAFANLGAGIGSGTQTANIVFRDSFSNPLSLTGATFLGSFPHQWAGQTFDDPASFDLNSGIWSYIGNSQNVEGASAIFFLTNIPTNVASVEFTVNSNDWRPLSSSSAKLAFDLLYI